MANVTTLKPLQILQKRVIRIIGKVAYGDYTAPLFKNVSDIYTLEFIHDHLYTQQSISLQSVFSNTQNKY